MAIDPAFVGVGKQVGYELWRIEQMSPVKQPEVNGKFYEGDSYILLVSAKKNIHFWLGKETSIDEAGVAAYKTVELDEAIGGGVRQYREVQGSESALFLSYFKKPINGKGGKGIEYLPGGVASGFKHVERDVYRPRLLEVKGKNVARVKEVPLKNTSLTQGDAYVLDLGLEIYIFIGASASRQEKMKATEVACHIDDDERGGRAEVFRLEDDPKNATFWNTLGGYKDMKDLAPGLPDTDVPDNFVAKLFMISDDSGEVKFTEVDTKGKLSRDMLKSEEVFLIHGRETIYLWIGKNASQAEKRESMPSAVKYMKQAGLPNSMSVQKIPDGVESGSFIKEFTSWVPKREARPTVTRTASGRDMSVEAASFASKKVKDKMEDDIVAAEEKLQIWRIENFACVEEKEELYGQFYSGDSYIVLYTFKRTKTSKEEFIIYFWLGQHSSTDEKGTAALLTKDLDDRMGGAPVQCRVVEGKEPLHFRRLFKGKMIVHHGGVPSGFRQQAGAPVQEAEREDVKLYAVHGATPLTTIAKQVHVAGQAINSEDCFILITPADVFLFKGSRSTEQEKVMADNVTKILSKGRHIESVAEGAVPAAFWSALGGKVDIPAHDEDEEPARDPRLFLASTVTGVFDVEEIENFDQSDLSDEDVMLLDTYDEVFVWVGNSATIEEETLSKEFAVKYIAAAAKVDGRSLATPTVRIQAGKEPFIFTRHFLDWDEHYFEKNKFVDPYEAKLAKMKEGSAAPAGPTKQSSLRAVAPVTSSAPQEEDDAPKFNKYAIPLKKTSRDLSEPAHVAPVPVKDVKPAIAAVKSTYDTGKLPPMLAAKVEAKPVAPAASTSAGPITPDMYLPYETLRDTKKPVGVDVERKEQYLADDVFEKLFGMSKTAFAALPGWKRTDQKKKLGLF